MRDLLEYVLAVAVPTGTIVLAMLIFGNHPTNLQIFGLICVGGFLYGAASEVLRLLRSARRIQQPVVDRTREHRSISHRAG